MPHIVLEYSANVEEKSNLKALLQRFHSVIVEILAADLSACKSRAVQRETFVVGDDATDNAFIHINLRIMPGRTQETIKQLGDRLLAVAKDHFAGSFNKLNLQITLEINEISQPYFKVASA